MVAQDEGCVPVGSAQGAWGAAAESSTLPFIAARTSTDVEACHHVMRSGSCLKAFQSKQQEGSSSNGSSGGGRRVTAKAAARDCSG